MSRFQDYFDPGYDDEFKVGDTVYQSGTPDPLTIVEVRQVDYLVTSRKSPEPFALTLDEIETVPTSPLEGVGGHHNQIHGDYCFNCHNQGCDRCLSLEQLRD